MYHYGVMKTVLAVCGVLIFIIGLFSVYGFRTGERLAATRDTEETGYGYVDSEFLPCYYDVTFPERVMAEARSQAVRIDMTNTTEATCSSTLSLRAPGFDISPNQEDQEIRLEKGGEGSLSWVIMPRKTGTYEIAVSDILNTQVHGITVTNMFGLTALQAKVVSGAGSLFGPMLTIPWWWERLRRRKKESGSKSEQKDA